LDHNVTGLFIVGLSLKVMMQDCIVKLHPYVNLKHWKLDLNK